MTVTAAWGHDRRATLATAVELDALLDRLHDDACREGRPQDVQLTDDDARGTLGIVVGHERSYLNHVPENGDPPYLASLGDEHDDRAFAFYVAGDHHSETAWRHTIPAPAAREVARTFLTTGQLDQRVRWTEL